MEYKTLIGESFSLTGHSSNWRLEMIYVKYEEKEERENKNMNKKRNS